MPNTFNETTISDDEELNIGTSKDMRMFWDSAAAKFKATQSDGSTVIYQIDPSTKEIQDANGAVLNGFKTRKYTIAYNETFPYQIHTVADGDAIVEVFTEVTTTFDGTTVLKIGDGADDNGYLDLTSGDTAAAAYYGVSPDERGAYLYDPTNHHKITKMYTGADTIDIDKTSGTPTQGSLDIWIVWYDLK